jgi:hypothetical protein
MFVRVACVCHIHSEPADFSFSVVDVIAAKRDGKELSRAQIEWFVGQFNAGHIADYQA